MAKLTDSQRLIRRLQSKFTNREIAELLGYKSSSSVSRVSRGTGNLSSDKIRKAEQLAQEYSVRKSPLSKSQVKKRQQKLRKEHQKKPILGGEPVALWRQSSIEAFLHAMVPIYDHERYTAKMDKHHLNYVYYSRSMGAYLLSDTGFAPSELQPWYVSAYSFRFVSEKTRRDGDSYTIVQYPYYVWMYVVTDRETWDAQLAELHAFTERTDEPGNYDEAYQFTSQAEELSFLAFIIERG